MASIKRFLPELFGIGVVLICHAIAFTWFRKPWQRRLIWTSGVISVAGLVLNAPPFWHLLPPGGASYQLRAAAMFWALAASGTTIAWMFARRIKASDQPDPTRRAVLRAAQTAITGAPALLLGYGALYERRVLVPSEVDIPVPGLPKDLHHLRIAQISDIHLGDFVTPGHLHAAVSLANNFRPHLSLVTGDLITRDADPLDECLRELRGLRADSGVWGCLGNHEIYAYCEDYAEHEAARFGLRFLRGKAETLRFGDARLRLAGVDYQRMKSVYLPGAEALQEAGAYNVLLSHNPDVFEVAAAQKWDLTLSGHTHGGQVTVEYLNQHLNLARFFTPYVYGHYERESRHLYVTRGIGTVGVPVRIGAPPEVALIRLCAT